MINRDLAHKLLRLWAKAQNREVSHVSFPKVSPMFRDYQSGYRASLQGADDELIPELVGAVLHEMRPAYSQTIRQYYFEGRDIKPLLRTFNLAMHDFCKRYDSIAADDLSNSPALDRAIL